MGFFGNLAADKYDRQYSDGYLLKRVASYFAPYRGRVWWIVISTIVFALIGAAIPIVVAGAIEVLSSENGDRTVLFFLGAMFAIAIFDYGMFWARRLLIVRLVSQIIDRLRKDAVEAAVHRDLEFYDENKSGKIVSRITNDTQELMGVLMVSSDIISQFLEFVVLFFVLLSIEWRLTLVLSAMFPLVFGVTTIFRRLARVVTRQGSRAMAAVNDMIQESVSGIGIAKNFRQEAMIYEEFDTVNKQSYRINLRRGGVFALIFPTLNALAGFAIASIVYTGALAVYDGSIQLGAWFLFVQSIDRFWFPFINLAAFWGQLQTGFTATERIFALIDAENTVIQSDKQQPGTLRGEIAFRDVTFAYKTGESILSHFDLNIQPGESIAFVGHTGAGKSTVAKLITRFYEFQQGELLIDGRDIRTFDIQAYRTQLGIVPQQPFLFSGTVLDNIRYGRPDATDAEIEEIAYSVGGGEWLDTMPDGLNTDVGERGARLSMGQRQLVSLLRVLVQKPAIFILDEATASIDPFTEMQIQEALELILKRSTSILIAHRLSTVRRADRIIVLKQGSIIEHGSHDALLAQGGHYAELYNTYFRHQSLSYIENSRQLLEHPEKAVGD